jgi:hypothetical protein
VDLGVFRVAESECRTLAYSLRHHGVTEFATRNLDHFQDFGFSRVWDPLQITTA